MALPWRETRDGVVVRDTTARDGLATFVDVVRDTTLRDVFPRDAFVRDVTTPVLRDAVTDGRPPPDVFVARDTVFVRAPPGVTAARDAAVRDVTVRAVVAELLFDVNDVPRDTIFDDVPRDAATDGRAAERTVPDARGDASAPDDVGTVFAGAIGSANTARIDNNVEQTKNAPANKNTVPIAFFTCSAKLRLFINTLLYSGNNRKTRCSMVFWIH